MRLAKVMEQAFGAETAVEFRAFDGSRAGVEGADVQLAVRSPLAMSYMVRAPGALGLARAYVAGYVDVIGDMFTALTRLSRVAGEVRTGGRMRLVRELSGSPLLRAAMLRRVTPPPQEVRINRLPLLRGLRHTKGRDAEVISHHYDVSNRFYGWVLGPSMAYTCACYPAPDASLERAQWHKHDLVARKLDLTAGMRLLDIGCGWGGMVLHAAREYGVQALGVTLSRQQAEWAQKAIAEAGLSELAEVRHMDYRDVREGGFDAISSIGLTEHVGKANLASYFSFLADRLRPGGRLLNHCITRPDDREPANRRAGFINRYVFPDGELEGPGHLVSMMHDNGFEVRHEENLREHYARTLAGWCRNLDEHWDAAVDEVGEGTARVWRLYMAGSRLGFERNWIQLHQVLGVKVHADGRSGMPMRPDWEPPVPR